MALPKTCRQPGLTNPPRSRPMLSASSKRETWQPRNGDRFGESLSLYGNFLAIGCPKREDVWLHTGTSWTDWEGEDVGAVYLYRRDSSEMAFYFFQVISRLFRYVVVYVSS